VKHRKTNNLRNIRIAPASKVGVGQKNQKLLRSGIFFALEGV
jgi:hypothetical protein